MEVLSLLIPMALGLGIFFLCLFIWATKSGQYDDLETPAKRMLFENNEEFNNKRKEQ